MYKCGFSNFDLPLLVRNSIYQWPKLCEAFVTRYDLVTEQNLEPLSYVFLFWTSVCCDNIKGWSVLKVNFSHRYWLCEKCNISHVTDIRFARKNNM